MIRSWLARLRTQGCASATLARRASSARTFSTFAHGRGLLPTDVAARIEVARRGRTLPSVMSAAAVEQVFATGSEVATASAATQSGSASEPEAPRDPRAAAVQVRDLLIVELLYASAMRVSELCGLDLGDIDEARRLLRVIGKGDRERRVPYGVPAERALECWLETSRPLLVNDASAGRASAWDPGTSARPPHGSYVWYMNGQNGHLEYPIWLHMG